MAPKDLETSVLTFVSLLTVKTKYMYASNLIKGLKIVVIFGGIGSYEMTLGGLPYQPKVRIMKKGVNRSPDREEWRYRPVRNFSAALKMTVRFMCLSSLTSFYLVRGKSLKY